MKTNFNYYVSLKQLLGSNCLLVVLFAVLSFSTFAQTQFSATGGVPMNPSAGVNFTATGSTITNLGTKAVDIAVTGVGTLDDLANQLAEIHIDFDASCGSDLNNIYNCAIVAPDNTTFAWVTFAIGSTGNWTQPNDKITLSFREPAACLQTRPAILPASPDWSFAEISNFPNLPAAGDVSGRSGFFRIPATDGVEDLGQIFDGVDADGTWSLRVGTGSINNPCISDVRLVFGDPTVTDFTAPTDGNTCATAIAWNGEPLCLSTTGKDAEANTPGFSGGTGSSVPGIGAEINGTNCYWNNQNDNTSWLSFVPSDADVCITISGMMANLQSIVVKPSDPGNPCDLVWPGGTNDTRWELASCPREDIYQANTGTVRNQNHCFTAIPGETYYLVVDGNNSANSDFYVSGTSGFSAPTVNCPADYSVCITETPFALSGATPGGGTYTGTGVTAGTFDPVAAGVGIHTITYDNGGDVCTFDITVIGSPLVDNPADETVCDSYTLPALTNGGYYETTGGVDPILAGTAITSTQTIFVYNETGGSPNCTSENSFLVTVNDSPIIDPLADQEHCDSYTLPAITGTNLTGGQAYYTGSGGTGTSYNPTDVINYADFGAYPVTLYIYDETGTTPNCSHEVSFDLTLIETPTYTLDPTDPSVCDGNDGSILIENLEASTSYSYSYTDGVNNVGPTVANSNGTGQILIDNLEAGSYTVTVSLVGATETCSGTPTLTTLNNPGAPQIDAYPLVQACDSYTVPAITGTNLTGGQAYYDGAGGTGNVVPVGTVINASTIIYAYDINGSCSDQKVLNITINATPVIDPLPDLEACDQLRLPSPMPGTNLTGNEAYYTQPNGGGTMYLPGETIAYADLASNPLTLYVYDETGTTPNCFDEESFTITIHLTPEIDPLLDQEECDSYTLPAITGNNLTGSEAYYDDVFGAGTSYTAGQTINFADYPNYPVTLYIYDETGTTPNCSDQQSFDLTLYATPSFNLVGQDPSACDLVDGEITITDLEPSTDYNITYTDGVDTEGPNVIASNASGEIVITSLAAGSYWVTAEVTGGTCPETTETVSLANPGAPIIDALTPVEACDTYTVPAITGQDLTGSEAFYDAPNGAGNVIPVGTEITASTTIYAYDENGNCSDEKNLVITINNTPQLDPIVDVEVCDGYRLPDIEGTFLTGNEAYYTQPNGGGTMYAAGTTIQYDDMPSNPLTLYVYDETGTTPNCSDEVSFVLTIHATPAPIAPDNQQHCTNYILPAITGGNLVNPMYYTESQGQGTAYNEGDEIAFGDFASYPVTLYVYDETGTTPNCWSEDFFELTLYANPVLDVVADQAHCGSFELPAITGANLVDPAYYLAQNGQGARFEAGTIKNYVDFGSYPVTFYIYDETGTTPNCSDEVPFELTLYPDPNLTPLADQEHCDSFTLPVIAGTDLTNPSYYTEPLGQGDSYAEGDVINFTDFANYPVTLYVYDETGTTPNCSDEYSFELVIHQSPTLDDVDDQEACGSFTFPVIEGSNLVAPVYTTGAGGTGTTYTEGTTIQVDEFSAYPVTIYVYDEVNGTTCSAEVSFELTLHDLPTATISGEGGGIYCSYQKPADIVITVTGDPDYTLTYTVDGESFTVTSATSPLVLPGDQGVYELVELSDAHCTADVSGTASTEIVVKPTPEPPVVTADTDYCSNTVFTEMTAEGEGTITWYYEDDTDPYAVGNTATAQDLIGSSTYYVTATLDGCESEPTEVIATVIACDLVIPEAITPNGDGVNDVFYIQNLEAYPNTNIVIFNRWGTEIYSTDNYLNDWNGTSESQFNVGGNTVPEGTYYYLIEVGGDESSEMYGKVLKGWVYVKP